MKIKQQTLFDVSDADTQVDQQIPYVHMYSPHRYFVIVKNLSFLLIGVCFLGGALSLSLAQESGLLPGETLEEDKVRPTRISASVVDNEDPSVPILIAPANNSFLTTGAITFVWKASTDNTTMSHYQLILNGENQYGSIPLDNTTTAQYTLIYNPTTQEYSLSPSQNLVDGSYSWRVIAYDIHGNNSTSVTWTFTIDTLAPFFTITEIDGAEVYITTLDAESVPDEAIVLTKNQPALSGQGEAGSQVVLTIRLPGGATRTIEFEISANGTWSVQLPPLPRNAVIWLDFLITDQAGNISILENVPLILPTPQISIPIPPILLPVIPPPLRPELPILEIPILPIDELIPPPEQIVPPFVMDLTEGLRSTVQMMSLSAWPILLSMLALLLMLILPVLKMALFARLYSGILTKAVAGQILWLIGLDGWWQAHSVVVTYPQQEPVSHTVVRVRGFDLSQAEYVADLITDERGMIPRFELPTGEYRLSILDERVHYPVLNRMPDHLDWQRFYTGSKFPVTDQQPEPWLVIPVSRTVSLQESMSLSRRILSWHTLHWSIALVLIGVTIWQPSLGNLASTAIYLVGLGLQYWARRRSLRIEVITRQQQALPGTICLIRDEGIVKDVAQTGVDGVAHLQEPGKEVSLETINWTYHQTEGDKLTKTTLAADKKYQVEVLVTSER